MPDHIHRVREVVLYQAAQCHGGSVCLTGLQGVDRRFLDRGCETGSGLDWPHIPALLQVGGLVRVDVTEAGLWGQMVRLLGPFFIL